MTDKVRKEVIAKKSGNYMRGRAMALSFKPLSLQDVRDAYKCGAEEMERLIDNSMWWKSADGSELPAIDHEKKHLVEHISNYYGVDPKSEESAYLSGELGRLIWPAAAWVLCPRCRELR